jgi:hypothetical protein
MATSLLVFIGEYAPSYGERRDALLRLAARKTLAEGFPFEIGSFANLVADCTAEKIEPREQGLGRLSLSPHTARQTAHALWRWQLAQLVGAKPAGTDDDLFEQWMAVQPLSKRVRGWLYVARACGWHRSYGLWPRWWALRKASPRHWIYLVASSLLFQPTEDANPSQAHVINGNWAFLSRRLPIAKRTATAARPSWSDLAHDVVWNYREFLTGTRA